MDEAPDFFAPVRIVSQTQYGRRRNAKLSREGAPVPLDFWRRELAPGDVIVTHYEWNVGETWYLYLTWVEPEKEVPEEYWDKP